MVDADTRGEIRDAKRDLEPIQDYTDFSAPGYVQTGDWPTPSINALRMVEAQEDQERAREEAARIAAEQRAREETEWMRDFSIGPVAKPEDDTLRGYKRELKQSDSGKDEDRDIRFDGRKYGIFDAVIIHEAGVDEHGNSYSPAFNENHPHYNQYAPLRRNLAILRDYLLIQQFPDAVYKPGDVLPAHKEDKWNLNKVQDMARALGKELGDGRHRPGFLERWGQSATRLLTGGDLSKPNTSDFLEKANIPDQGIATLYNYLLEKQGKATMTDALMVQLTPMKWGLKPIEETPFSEENMRLYSRSSAMQNVADAMDTVATNIRSIETLSARDKAVSVEEAENILRNLRIQLGQAREGERLDLTDPDRSHASALLSLSIAFQDMMAGLVKIDPDVLHNPDLIAAAQAIEHASYQTSLQAALMLEQEGHPIAAQAMMARAQQVPDQFKSPMMLKEMSDRLKTGIEVASGLEGQYATELEQLRGKGHSATPNQQAAQQAAQAAALARRQARIAARAARAAAKANVAMSQAAQASADRNTAKTRSDAAKSRGGATSGVGLGAGSPSRSSGVGPVDSSFSKGATVAAVSENGAKVVPSVMVQEVDANAPLLTPSTGLHRR